MNIYDISKSAMAKLEVKLELVEEMDCGTLLRALREIEDSPSSFDKEVVKKVHNRLYDLGIMCM